MNKIPSNKSFERDLVPRPLNSSLGTNTRSNCLWAFLYITVDY